MSTISGIFSLIGLIMIILGIALFFIDGLLIWSIGFFVLGFMIGLLQIIWKIAGWADKSTRSFFYNSHEGRKHD